MAVISRVLTLSFAKSVVEESMFLGGLSTFSFELDEDMFRWALKVDLAAC